MKARKILVSLAALALVAAISIGGTLAYLTSKADVTNTFTVGKVAITMDETAVNTDGTALADTPRRTTNDYHLLPGKTYTKDPQIHVTTGSEDCYLFVTVDNLISDIEAANNNVAAQMAENGWVNAGVEGKTNLYVYVGTEEGASNPKAVAAGANVDVFETITIDGNVSNATLATYAGKTITVNAYAIQAEGFSGKTAAQIWAATGFTA